MRTISITLSMLFCISLFVLPVQSQDLTEGLVAYWDFNANSGDTAKDVSGNGHDGTLIGGTERTKDGKYGGALEFDAVNSEVDVPYHEDLNPEVFTITAWANVASNGTNHRAVVSSRDDFPQRGYIFYCTPPSQGNIWEFWIGAGASSWKPIRGPAVTFDEWDHLAGTYADGNHKLYVNGEFIGEENFDISVNTVHELLIGAGANETASHNYRFFGKIDEVRLYNRVLSVDEIAKVMDSESLDVEPSGKIAVTWGQIKTR